MRRLLPQIGLLVSLLIGARAYTATATYATNVVTLNMTSNSSLTVTGHTIVYQVNLVGDVAGVTITPQ